MRTLWSGAGLCRSPELRAVGREEGCRGARSLPGAPLTTGSGLRGLRPVGSGLPLSLPRPLQGVAWAQGTAGVCEGGSCDAGGSPRAAAPGGGPLSAGLLAQGSLSSEAPGCRLARHPDLCSSCRSESTAHRSQLPSLGPMSPGGKRWQCLNRKPASPHITRGDRRQSRQHADSRLQAVGGFSPGGTSLLCSGPSPSLHPRGPGVGLRRVPLVWLRGLHGHGASRLHTAHVGPSGPRPRRPRPEGGDPAAQRSPSPLCCPQAGSFRSARWHARPGQAGLPRPGAQRWWQISWGCRDPPHMTVGESMPPSHLSQQGFGVWASGPQAAKPSFLPSSGCPGKREGASGLKGLYADASRPSPRSPRVPAG